MELNINRIEVLTNLPGTDKISLYTDLETPFPDWTDGGKKIEAVLSMDVKKGTGAEYALRNFKRDIIVIDASNGYKKYYDYVYDGD